jgi:hypothetical protein
MDNMASKAMRSHSIVILAVVLLGIHQAHAAGGVLSSSFRRDFYLPDFPEPLDYPTPTQGGRIHLVVSNHSCDTITSAMVNGQQALNLPSSGTHH